MEDAMAQDFLTVAEVAKQLQLHAKTVLNFVHQGQLKAMRIGKQYRISHSDLRAFTRGTTTAAKLADIQRPRTIETSCVLHIDAVSPDQANRLSVHLSDACEVQTAADAQARIDTSYNEDLARLKIIVSGSAETAVYLMGLIPTLVRM
jgi:excisionase family DNA binding protein